MFHGAAPVHACHAAAGHHVVVTMIEFAAAAQEADRNAAPFPDQIKAAAKPISAIA
jgi:hypothetical protein